MALLSTSPSLPVPGAQLRAIWTLLQSGTNYVRVWCSSAPIGSELRKKIDETTQSRVEVYAGDGGEFQPWAVTFDVPGVYKFINQEYVRGGSAYGGGYQGAPASYPSETKVGDEDLTQRLQVMQRLTFPMGVGDDTATLVLWSNSGFVRNTTLATHGEASPALIDPSSNRMRAAIETTAVKTALAFLAETAAGQPWDTVIGTPLVVRTLLRDFRLPINAHLTQATVHNSNDADNSLDADWGVLIEPADLPAAVNKLLQLIRYHYTNDGSESGLVFGVGSEDYHRISGSNRADLVNLPLVQSVGDAASAYAALADIWRAHEAHRVSLGSTDGVHTNADNTNALTALASLPRLIQLHIRIFQALATPADALPPTEVDGLGRALSVGFERA